MVYSAKAPAAPDLVALQRRLRGEVIAPGSPGYDVARKPAMGRFHDSRPQAIVSCRDPGDVAEALVVAAAHGVPVAPRSGGHCLAGRSSTDGIVVDVTPMNAVSVSDGVATVGAGTRLGALYERLQQHGVTLPAGCGETVGVAGLTLGGGIGLLGRKYGLTCDGLLAAQVVLADGEVVECDERRHEDLFWALRGGGGGQFGVVTSFVFRVVPSPTATAFQVTWDGTGAADVIAAWQSWAPTTSDELNAGLRIVVPRGDGPTPTTTVFGAALAPATATREALGGLFARCPAEPAAMSYVEAPWPEVKRVLADGTSSGQPELLWNRSEFFRRSLPPEAITALLSTLKRDHRAGQLRELTFTPMGGAYNHVATSATAFAHRDERFLLDHAVTIDAGASLAAQASSKSWTARSWSCTHPWGTGRVYPNFPDPDLVDPPAAYHAANLARLLEIKRAYDPRHVFGVKQLFALP